MESGAPCNPLPEESIVDIATELSDGGQGADAVRNLKMQRLARSVLQTSPTNRRQAAIVEAVQDRQSSQADVRPILQNRRVVTVLDGGGFCLSVMVVLMLVVLLCHLVGPEFFWARWLLQKLVEVRRRAAWIV